MTFNDHGGWYVKWGCRNLVHIFLLSSCTLISEHKISSDHKICSVQVREYITKLDCNCSYWI